MYKYKEMRKYSHEEFVSLVSEMSEEEVLNMSANYGGYPILFRMSLDPRISHIPFIQTGSAVVVRDEKGRILLQQRKDNGNWGLPGGCQDLGERLETTAVRELYEETGIKAKEEDLVLINVLSGEPRKRTYPNGDIVYNNSTIYLLDINLEEVKIKENYESIKLQFFDIDKIPSNLHDWDEIDEYIRYITKNNN